MMCPVCGNPGSKIFQGKIMQKYVIDYFQCPVCAFVFTEKAFWIDEAYQDSITNIDTGIMQRNLDNTIIANAIVNKFYKHDGFFLDYGGGYGIFTRMMRDLGYNWFWMDKYSENLVARGFEWKEQDRVELCSAFELFEHFENPMGELEHLISISKSILFSTLVYDKEYKYKKFEDWWYYVPETGQHISFYSQKTLEYMARYFCVNYYKINNGMHLFSDKKINLVKFNFLVNAPLKYINFFIQRKNGLAINDMEVILKRRQK